MNEPEEIVVEEPHVEYDPPEDVEPQRQMVVRSTSDVGDWTGAAERGVDARKERLKIIDDVLTEGKDFGKIPGVDKPCLLKPGAEKVADALNLYPDYIPVKQVEDFDAPLFFYRYRCLLRTRGSNRVVATGVGSCNSMESRYRWRWTKKACPRCGQETIIKGKEEYGGGWLCWEKRGGCGAKFSDGDASVENQTVERVPNPDIFDQTNTIDKMAQKRAFVAASLNLGFSDQFTQDMDDMPQDSAPPKPAPPVKPPGGHDPRRTPPQKAQEAADGDWVIDWGRSEWKGKKISQVPESALSDQLDWLQANSSSAANKRRIKIYEAEIERRKS